MPDFRNRNRKKDKTTMKIMMKLDMKQASRIIITLAAVTAAALLALAGTPAAAQHGRIARQKSGMTMQSLSPLDKTFLKEVAQSNLAEMKYAPLVYKMAQKAETKQFAQRMVRDHGQAQQSLKFLAARKGFRLPTDPEKSEKAVLRRLSRERKGNFDAAYKHEMMRDHAGAVATARREISLGHDKDVKAYAAKVLPLLQGHLKMANALPIGGNYALAPLSKSGDNGAMNSGGKM